MSSFDTSARNAEVMGRDADALAASSNHLLNLRAKLSKVQRQAPPIPTLSPLHMRVDERFEAGVLTRAKKSVLPRDAIDRFSSEFYPIAPPRVDFVPGTNTRLIGRDPRVLY